MGVKCLVKACVKIKRSLEFSNDHVLDGVHEEIELCVELLLDANEIEEPVLARVCIDDRELDVCVSIAKAQLLM